LLSLGTALGITGKKDKPSLAGGADADVADDGSADGSGE